MQAYKVSCWARSIAHLVNEAVTAIWLPLCISLETSSILQKRTFGSNSAYGQAAGMQQGNSGVLQSWVVLPG